MEDIKSILPLKLIEELNSVEGRINEVRLRSNKRCILSLGKKEVILNYVISMRNILDILVKVSNNSLYAIQNDINRGFVTIKGGHRIGIVGEVVIEDGSIKNIKNISSMNIRVAREVIGSSDNIMKYILSNSKINNTLIVSPPGCGKTTMLRDILRTLGNKENNNIGIVDERGEIASLYNGKCYLDVGLRSDILTNVSKHKGIEMLVRSMGINIIATDEIGNKDDIEAIKYAFLSGVKLIFTMHGYNLDDVYNKTNIKEIINYFDTVIVLSKKNGIGTIENIHILNESNLEVV